MAVRPREKGHTLFLTLSRFVAEKRRDFGVLREKRSTGDGIPYTVKNGSAAFLFLPKLATYKQLVLRTGRPPNTLENLETLVTTTAPQASCRPHSGKPRGGGVEGAGNRNEGLIVIR